MSLSQALATAVSGLRASQSGLSIVAANVANAETPGYIRKIAVQVTSSAGGTGIGVRVAAIQRELDKYVQRQLRVETSGASYADLRAQFYQRLQTIYGAPGSDSSLENIFNNFTTALQALSTTPDDASARSAVISSAQVLTQQLNGMTDSVQSLRSDAELGLADSVATANEAMAQIAKLNLQLASSSENDATTATLIDQRDSYIEQLTQLMDINVVQNGHNQVTVFTSSGVQLVGTQAAKLEFDASGTVTPIAQWSLDPSRRTVGTIKLVGANGGGVDLVANKAFRSGKIAAYLEMRDQDLVQVQAQLDAVAAALASALSDRITAGTAASAGAQTGFDIDLAGMLAGNSFSVGYTDQATGSQHKVTFVRVDDPAALPLSNAVTTDPNDQVVGLDFSSGMASVLAQVAGAIAATGIDVSNPAGATLRILDDGAGNKVDVNAVSVRTTAATLAGGNAEFSFFVDANNLYTGAITSLGPQSVGLAGRINVNAAVIADPSKLVVYQSAPATDAGDPTRPNFIYDRLLNASLDFAPASGIGTTAAPFSGSLPSFLRQIVSQQGEAAKAAGNLQQGQDIVLNSLQQRFSEGSSVNIDEEMSNLLNLQNSYAANARVLSAVRDMLDMLMKI